MTWGDTVGKDHGMSLREVLEAVQTWYFRFVDGGWYGQIEIPFQAGIARDVRAKPEIRTAQALKKAK